MRSSVQSRRRCTAALASAKTPLSGRLLQTVTFDFHRAKKSSASFKQVGDELDRGPSAQRGEQALLGTGIPEPLQGIADLAAGNAQPDVLGGDVLHLVRLIEDNEVIAEQDAALDFLLNPPAA